MHVRRMILLVAGALLATRASAEGTSSGAQQPPPSDHPQSWYQQDARKARELGDRGVGAAKKGASGARDELNRGGQALNAKAVGSRTVTGRVADVSQDEVTVERSGEKPLALRVTKSTKVTVAGRKGSVRSLQQGDEVRASYAQSGGSATATKIDVTRTPAASGAGSEGARSPSTSPPGSTTK